MSMTKEHRERIRSNRVRIVEDLELNELFFSVLRQSNILTADMQEAIEAEKTRMTKVGKFLDTLVRRGQRAFEKFIEALCQSDQEELAEQLDYQLSSKYRTVTCDVDGDRVDETGKGFIEQTNLDMENNSPILVKCMASDFKEKLRSDYNRIYSMSVNEPCGRALIIANEGQTQLGTCVDLKNLSDLFEQLHFTPELKSDLTAEDIRKALQEEAKLESHNSASAFILFILNYGNKNYEIYGKDRHPIKIEEITSFFDGKNCQKLREKPKLFFIHTGEPDYSPGSGEPNITSKKSKSSQSDIGTDGASVSAKQVSNVVHEKADVLVTVSTSDVWRDVLKGSWFVRCLISVISKNAGKHHIEEIIAKINAVVKHYKDKDKPHLQIPEKRTTLRKSFYFMP